MDAYERCIEKLDRINAMLGDDLGFRDLHGSFRDLRTTMRDEARKTHYTILACFLVLWTAILFTPLIVPWLARHWH